VGPNRLAALSAVPQTVQSDDEDAAENVRAPDENFSLIHGEGVPAAPPARPAVPEPAVPPALAKASASRPVLVAKAAPTASPVHGGARADALLEAKQAQLLNTAVDTASRPLTRPAVHGDGAASDGDASPTPTPGHNWTIQIGAYADKAMADAQLKTYYGKAQDVLARANRIIAPITSSRGHVLYRARFGLFAEQEARDVCSRLTQRGQTCFAAVQTR